MKENGNQVTNVSATSSVTNDDLFVDDLPPAQNELRSDFIESPGSTEKRPHESGWKTDCS